MGPARHEGEDDRCAHGCTETGSASTALERTERGRFIVGLGWRVAYTRSSPRPEGAEGARADTTGSRSRGRRRNLGVPELPYGKRDAAPVRKATGTGFWLLRCRAPGGASPRRRREFTSDREDSYVNRG